MLTPLPRLNLQEDQLRAKPQPCCTALHLQCSAGQLQLGAGGKSLFSFTLAQSFAAFEENQPLCLLLMSPSFPNTVVSDF